MVGGFPTKRLCRRLLPRGAQSQLVDHWRVHFRVQHRFGTRRRTGRRGRNQRRSPGPLRIACMVFAGIGVGIRAVLYAVHGFHHARVPGTAFQSSIPLRVVDCIDHHLHRLEDRGGNLCRRRRVRHVIAGTTIDSFWIGSVLVIVLTGLYTALGGMRAVAYNDAVQTFVLILGSFSLTAYGLVKLGGWHELRHWCGSEMFNLWKPMIPAGVQGTWAPVLETDAAGNIMKEAWYFNGNFPWVGMLICAPIVGLWYWCTDQYIVQRALGAPNETVARRGSIFASFLKLFPVYLFIIPGLICYALAKSGKIPALGVMVGADGRVVSSVAQGSFPMMVQYLLPPGLRGLVVAGLLSALMGSLAGVFNACSTLFTVDLYEKWRPGASQHQIVRVGRIATASMIVVALAGRSGLFGAAYLRCVLPRRVLQADERSRCIVGHDCRLPARHFPHDRGYACRPRPQRIAERVHVRIVSLDRQQHLLSVLQRADHDGVCGRDGGGQPPDR